MPVPYTIPTINDTATIYSMTKFLTVHFNFMPLVIGLIWIIALVGSLSQGSQSSRAFLYSSYILSIISIVCVLIGLLSPTYMYFSFLMVGASLIWHYLDRSPGL